MHFGKHTDREEYNNQIRYLQRRIFFEAQFPLKLKYHNDWKVFQDLYYLKLPNR